MKPSRMPWNIIDRALGTFNKEKNNFLTRTTEAATAAEI